MSMSSLPLPRGKKRRATAPTSFSLSGRASRAACARLACFSRLDRDLAERLRAIAVGRTLTRRTDDQRGRRTGGGWRSEKDGSKGTKTHKTQQPPPRLSVRPRT